MRIGDFLFDLPFERVIEELARRNVVLPEQYYGSDFEGLHRQLSFSIAGVASLDQLQLVLNSLTESVANGTTFAEWQKNVDVKALGLPAHRRDNIFRTNTQSSYNRGRWEQFQENKETQGYLMLDAINDTRTRPSHAAMDGIIRKVDDPFWNSHYPPNGFRSILPNQRVSANSILGLKAFYSGKAIEVFGESGGRFSVTAQHPILTRRGWVMSDEIKIGDELVCYRSEIGDSSPSTYLNENNLPPTIKEVFDTLGSYIRTSAPRTAMNLHCNLEFINGDVEIVGMDRKLMGDINASIDEFIKQFNLTITNNRITNTSGNSPLMRIFSSAAFSSCVRRFCRPLLNCIAPVISNSFFTSRKQNISFIEKFRNILTALLKLGSNSFNGHSIDIHINDAFWNWLSEFRSSATNELGASNFTGLLHGSFNTSITDVFIGSFDVNPDSLGAVINAHSSKVKFDKIVNLRLFDYCGHVYDLETKSGHILAYGGDCDNHYILSNCRCRCIPLSKTQAEKRSKDGEGLNKSIDDNVKPDSGWSYNVGKDLTRGVNQAIQDRKNNPAIEPRLLNTLELILKLFEQDNE